MNIVSHVIVPDSGKELLRRELASAFAEMGCTVSRVPAQALQDNTSPWHVSHLGDKGPFLLFSVNFQGLEPLRQTLEQVTKGGGRIAVWCVDNPWNLLAGVRDPRWRELALFVTDSSFIAPLQAHGAVFVRHLPLASCPECFAPDATRDAAFPPPADLAPFVFVGRSAFPGKERFFAGQHLPEALSLRAEAMLAQGLRPDLRWWEQELQRDAAGFWPGKAARLPALGAENANLAWRSLCLKEAALAGSHLAAQGAPGLDLFGDEGWSAALPAGARLAGPVDYYARLPGLYAKARYSLCLTSLQLPEGLNQRHFDVWTAGGVCLSDATPGLRLFPEELTRPVCFQRPDSLEDLAERLEKQHSRQTLIADWQKLLHEKHRYTHRAQTVLDCLA